MKDVFFEKFTRNGVEYSVYIDREFDDADYYRLTFASNDVDDIASSIEIVRVRYNGAYIFTVSFCMTIGCTILFRMPKGGE